MFPRARSILPALILALAATAVAPVALAQDASPAVDVLLSSPRGRARARAAEAIGRTRPRGGRQALEAALNDPDTHVRRAAAEALGAYGDTAAVVALLSHGNDRDRHVRAAVQGSVADLRSHMTATPSMAGLTMASVPAGAARPMVVTGGGPGRYTLPMGALDAPVSAPPVDWRRVRYVVGVGSVVNQAREAAAYSPVVRMAIEQELGGHQGLAARPAVLPPEVESRVRSGAVRSFSLEGGVVSLRRTAMPMAAAVRAEVSLLLIAEPAHAIVGTIAGAATAQEPVAPGTATGSDRLTAHAIQAAVRSALGHIERDLMALRR